ncbi:MAG: MBL fold metallo-hydrolase [Lachnospiraceae bacterium]|nr:MBL fold metallo-hydrolase [Lachnospiraceae bacterium]
MKKTYITSMPNHIGAFLKASECFAALEINITRVSYNKAIDSHTLFIEVQGDKEKLKIADKQLEDIGYIQTQKNDNSIVLLEFHLKDNPGSVTEVLRLIQQYRLNISYISSQENGTYYQAFKMGLFVDNEDSLRTFLDKVKDICPVRMLDYNHSEKIYDNSIFYQSFVSGLINTLGIPEKQRDVLLVNSNLVMQMLDEKGLSPYKTFESISRFAELLAKHRGSFFSPRITSYNITENTEIILIEPPCGSNTAIIKSKDEVLFIDCGYALYKEEMINIFNTIIKDFNKIKKRIFITHADVDHCGLLPLFDEIIASKETKECLVLGYENKNDFREQNYLHKPYVKICKTLTFYKPPKPDKIKVLWNNQEEQKEPLEQIGFFDIGEMHFEVYKGKGGHLKGETVLIDYINKVAFTGDIFINTHGLTIEQATYNQYAPVLMTSVDTNSELCAIERRAILQRLGEGNWQIFGAHGIKKDYTLKVE